MSCETCKNHASATTPESIPYIAHETAMARNERSIKRMVVALVMAIVLMFASNALWLWAWMQYDYVSEEIVVEQDAQDGDSVNFIGNDGDILNGVPESDNPQTETNEG